MRRRREETDDVDDDPNAYVASDFYFDDDNSVRDEPSPSSPRDNIYASVAPVTQPDEPSIHCFCVLFVCWNFKLLFFYK